MGLRPQSANVTTRIESNKDGKTAEVTGTGYTRDNYLYTLNNNDKDDSMNNLHNREIQDTSGYGSGLGSNVGSNVGSKIDFK